MPSILSTTLCYPDAASPGRGIFVHRRLAAIHRLRPLQVVAPVPWFPFLRKATAETLPGETPSVSRPRMYYLPGVFKRMDARAYSLALRRAVKPEDRLGLQLVDSHFVWPDGVGAWRFARDANLPFVCTIRGKLVSQARESSKRRLIRRMLLESDGLIAVSRSLAQLACEVAETDLAVRVIPNGVDAALFHRFDSAQSSSTPDSHTRETLGWSRDARYVVSVGHLQALKGFHTLVDAWPEVRRRCGDVRLMLVGGRAGEPAYERRLRGQVESINQASKQSAVTILGRRTAGDIANLLNAADLFALNSRSEGWCNSMAEALACGCPVVATDVGGNREIVADPRLGKLVPLGDITALAESISCALGNDWDRQAIAGQGGKRHWQQVAAECVSVFDDVLTRQGEKH